MDAVEKGEPVTAVIGVDHDAEVAAAHHAWGAPFAEVRSGARVRMLGCSASDDPSRRDVEKVVIDTGEGVSAARLVADEIVTCLLTRDGGPASLAPIDAALLARTLDE